MNIIFVKFLQGVFMSLGLFKIGNYEADSGEVHPIRIQPESAEGENDEAGAITNTARFRRGGSRRRYGNFARFITIGRTIGEVGVDNTPYSGATVYAKLTIFVKDKFDLLKVGETFSYGGLDDWTVASKTPERVS